jgi:predicted nucleotidyltransferase
MRYLPVGDGRMKVERDSLIAGRPIRKVRDFLRWAKTGCFRREGVVAQLGEPDATDDLIAAGLIQEDGTRRDGVPRFEVTDAGVRLASTNLVPRIMRAKADAIMDGFMQRVAEVNASSELISRVAEVYVFGSYITDVPKVGDIDLSVKLERKIEEGWIELSHARAVATGRRMDFIDSACYGDTEVMRILKARSRYLVFTSPSTLEELACPRKRIYRV